MAKLIYSAITSLDGYVADADGSFDWAEPDEELHAFINDRERSVGTYLYGRRMYEVMVAWESLDLAGQAPSIQDYAGIWRAAEKIVFSRTLQTGASKRTRIEASFDVEAIRRLKLASPHDISIGGPELAGEAFKAGLVDECHLFINPISVGGGNPALPRHAPVPFELLGEHRFRNGVVHLHYRVIQAA